MKKAVILLSGGLDSTTLLAVAQSEGYDIHALSFNYGQRHKVELESAQRVAKYFDVTKHLVIDINLREIGGSALTAEIEVPKGREQITDNSTDREIPVTYVPARNAIFLSFALAWAETLEAADIFIGANAIDYSGYPDCRPEYIEAFEKMARLATRAGSEGKRTLRIQAPLLRCSKKEIIQKGMALGVDYGATHSCYDPGPGGMACGRCDACLLRLKGFAEAGIDDPLPYHGKG